MTPEQGTAADIHFQQPAWKKMLAVLAAVTAVTVGIVYWHDHRAGGDQSARIATQIGAQSCYSTGYELTNRLDHSKATIYDCLVGGRELCVTEDGGIPRDSTEMVRLVFRGTLGTDRPSCLAS